MKARSLVVMFNITIFEVQQEMRVLETFFRRQAWPLIVILEAQMRDQLFAL